MTEPTPEFEAKVRIAFAQIEPERTFCGCKVAVEEKQSFVRVYSRSERQKALMPGPYQVYRFDLAAGLLSEPSKEESLRYAIPNYK